MADFARPAVSVLQYIIWTNLMFLVKIMFLVKNDVLVQNYVLSKQFFLFFFVNCWHVSACDTIGRKDGMWFYVSNQYTHT